MIWWGGGGEKEEEEEAGVVKGEESVKTNPVGKMFQLRPGVGGAGGAAGTGGALGDGVGGRGENTKKGPRPTGQRVPTVPVSDKVDLTAHGEGLLWLPTSMTPPECSGAEDDGSSCDSTVRFCLMNIAEYRQTPWKFPMAAMLQKKSLCNKADNMRAFRLSALRVSEVESLLFVVVVCCGTYHGSFEREGEVEPLFSFLS